jgi:competence protein ComEC
MSNTAQSILMPPPGVLRAAFLYVGQGESTLLFIPNGSSHLSMLIDSNQGRNTGGIDLIRLLKDLFVGSDSGLDYFVNTHPHSDHAGDLDDIQKEIEIANIWHSGHNPGRNHADAFNAIQRLRATVRSRGGEDRTMLGTRSGERIGEATVNFLSPASYVADEIADEDPEVRYRRIHEHCSVIRIGYGTTPAFILITGDSDKCAWQEHITDYHGGSEENRIKADILSASHHGSRTFFKTCEDDPDPYTRHMDLIQPTYLVISSPVQDESCHGHPHDDAMELYRKYVTEENILHTGEGKTTHMCDIFHTGQFHLTTDNGDLASTYGFRSEPSDQNGGSNLSRAASGPFVHTKIDDRPMG